jgi:very-short-patch-repair endonuclease
MFKTRRLRWHYRSKHESLIAFSNKHFYDEDLVIFPSPFKSSPEFGVKLVHVAHGRFASGRNVEEARELVKSVGMHLKSKSHESIGIVSMNAEQRDEIERQLDQLAKDDPALLLAIEENRASEEPLFIKNLENVQGDERDVIYISMTYGPESVGGRTMQRFGPINSGVGWRRLNVLFTRSKKRMHIFSSMTSGDVLAGAGSSRGVRALKAFLEYTEKGHLHNSVPTLKAADSDFEIAVLTALENYGYECEPQLGVAGFFLDIAVRDPGKPGRFLIGIECDGATYHSAKSARDRDRLRQEILENLGWKIHRIWSTDWFKNPQAQLRPILNELEKLRTPPSKTETTSEIIAELKPVDQAAENIQDQIQDVEQTADISLQERMHTFNKLHIKPTFPDTPEEQRLLRQEMIDALLEHLPCSKAEFLELIPAFLRTGTSSDEATLFLDPVLKLVGDFA